MQKVIRQVRYYKGEEDVQNHTLRISLQCSMMWRSWWTWMKVS